MSIKKDFLKSKDYYKKLIEDSGDAIITVDLKGAILTWNKNAEKIFGFSEEEMLGAKFNLFKKLDLDFYIKETEKNGPIQNIWLDLVNKHKDELHVLMTLIPIQGNEKKVSGIGLIAKDITSLKKVEIMKSEFLSMLSHELRTPLSQICGFTEVLLEGIYGAVNEQQQEALHTILRQGQHLTNLINSILWFSGVESGREIKLVKTPVSFEGLVNETIETLKDELQNKKITIQVNSEIKDTSLSVDIGQLEKVVSNILENAIKFSKEESVIKIHIKKKNGRILTTVEDNGIGIETEHLVRIFEKFYRVDTSNTRCIEGIGMGLAIAKAIVEVHRGKIWAESGGLGKGTKIIVEIPIV
ncbi:ATP-binding protein [Candidatus Margulisiibacteriota bacterium]